MPEGRLPDLAHGATLSHRIIGLAMRVHRTVGPGLLESIYEECLCCELDRDGLAYERQKPLRLVYQGINLDCAHRADIIVADDVILEIKAVDHLLACHEAQTSTYLRLSGCHIGLLMNFNGTTLKEGLRRFVR